MSHEDYCYALEREVESLQQQLAAALVAVKMKDEALRQLSFCAMTTGGVSGRDDELCRAIDGATKALAIQPDETALKVWLGEPHSFKYQINNCYGVPVWIDTYPKYGEVVLKTLPLFAPNGWTA